MDKPNHKDGMLAAGKKRLQQFRQKRQNKGGSSKEIKSETDIEHGRAGLDAESGSSTGTTHNTSNEGTQSSHLEAPYDRSDIRSDGLSVDLRVVRADDVDSSSEQGYSSTLPKGSREDQFLGNALESSLTLEQQGQTVHDVEERGSGEICLRIDELEQSSTDVQGNPQLTDHAVSMASDLRIAMGETLVPKVNAKHGLPDDVGGMTEFNKESSVMTPQIVEDVQEYVSTMSNINASAATVEMETSPELATEVTCEDHSTGVSSLEGPLHQVWDCLQSESPSYHSTNHLENAADPDNGALMDLRSEKSTSKFERIREVTDERTLANSSNVDLIESDDLDANKANEDAAGTRLQMDSPSVSMLPDVVEDGVSSYRSSSVSQSEDKLDGVSAYGGASGASLNSSLSQAEVDLRNEGQVTGSNSTQAGTTPLSEVDMQSLFREEVVDIVELQSEAHMSDSMGLGPLEEEETCQKSVTAQMTESRNEEYARPPLAPVNQAGSDVAAHVFEEGHKPHNLVNLIAGPNLKESARSCESYGNTGSLGSPDGEVAISSSYVKSLSEESGECEQQPEEIETQSEVPVPEEKVLTNIQEKQAQGERADAEEALWEDQKVRESTTVLDLGVDGATILALKVDEDMLPMTQSNPGHLMELDSTGHEAHNPGHLMELDSTGHEAHNPISLDSDSGAVDAVMNVSRDFELRSGLECSSTGILMLDVVAGAALGSGPKSPPVQGVIDGLVMNEVSDSNLVVGDPLSTWESPRSPQPRMDSHRKEVVAEAEVKKVETRTKVEPTSSKDEEHPGHVEAHRANEVANVPSAPDGGGSLSVPSYEAEIGGVPEGSNHPKEELESALTSSYALNTETGLDIVLEQGNDEASSSKAWSSFHSDIPILNPDLSSDASVSGHFLTHPAGVECHVHGDVDSDMPFEPASKPVGHPVVDSESDVMPSVGLFSMSYSMEQDGKRDHGEITESRVEKAPHGEVDLQPCLASTSQIDLVISGADPGCEVVSLDASLGNDEYLPPPDSMHGTISEDLKDSPLELLPRALDLDAAQSGGTNDSKVVSQDNDESLPPLDSMHGTLDKDSKNFLMELLPRGLDPDAAQSGGTNDSKVVSQEGGHSLCEVEELKVDDEVQELLDLEFSRNVTEGLRSPCVLHTEDKQLHEVLEEKTRLESFIKELKESLGTQEVALEKLTNDHNCQAAKTVAERDSCMQVLAHVAIRLRHLVSLDSELDDGDTILLSNLSLVGSGQVPELVNLDLCRHGCDSWIDKLSKALEDNWQARAGQKQLEDLLCAKDGEIQALAQKIEEFGNELETSVKERKQLECRTSQLQELLCLREADLERLSNEVLELSRSNELAMVEVSESREARVCLEDELKDLQKLHAEQEASLSKRVLEFSEAHDMAMAEVAKLVEDRSCLEGEVIHLQQVNEEQNFMLSSRMMELSQNHDLALGELGKAVEERASLENKVKHLQEMHSRTCMQAGALSDKVSAVVGDFLTDNEAVSGDIVGILDLSVASLLRHCETTFRENEHLHNKVSDSEADYESIEKELALAREQINALTVELTKITKEDGELNRLRAIVSEKDVELGHLNQQVSLLKMELSKAREERETKLQEAEQKLLGVRERLSMAVTKGKGLVQQRDNLKHLLAEKTAELESMASSYKHELHTKTVALEEAENRVKLNAEAVERVEALESELSYIRNSANTLRESFLQKDAVLQKIEELLEDVGLPEELQMKDTFERIEWLLEAYAHKNSSLEGQHEDHYASSKVPREISDASEQALLHMQEVEQLNRKCDDLLRKYRGMAEQSAMLEQSLLERNLLIQRWEELLDTIEVPASVQSKEPEDKIQWLGMAVSDAQSTISRFQAEMESMQAEAEALNRAKDAEADNLHTGIGVLNQAVERLQEENLALSSQILEKDEELKRVALDMEEITLKFNAMSTQSKESPQAEVRHLEHEREDELQSAEMEALVTSVRTLLSQVLEGDEVDKVFSTDIPPWKVLECSVEVLVDSCKAASLEAMETRRKLDELSVAASKSEREKEMELQGLHELLSLRSADMGKLTQQLEKVVVEKSSLEEVMDGLQEQVKAVSEELRAVREELSKSRLEVSQGDEKLASVREKLSMAVKKGKSVVQQRDAMRQSLDEKTAEFEQLLKERESESLTMAKVKQRLQHHMQQVELLEAELAANRDYASGLEKSVQESNRILQKLAEALEKVSASGAPRSGDMVERMQWVSQHLNDLQRKASMSEQEAKKSRRDVELFALELEEMQARMDSLADELMHADKNISTLMEEKKVAEASKADAGLRLEHAMANVNSLLYELNESRESLANLQHENMSLKESLSAQIEEIRNKQTKADSELKEMTQLYDDVHVLRGHLGTFVSLVANQVSKMRDCMERTTSLVLSILEEFKDYGAVLSPAAQGQLDNISSNWGIEFPMKAKISQDWKQGVTSTLRFLCEEMEVDLQNSRGYLEKSITASEQDTAALSRLLLEMRDGMLFLRKEADAGSSLSSLIIEKDGQIKALEDVCKLVVDKVQSTIDELEDSGRDAGGQHPRYGTSPDDVLEGGMPSSAFAGDLQAFMATLLERLSARAKDFVHLCQQLHIQGDRESELLRKEVSDAMAVIELMGQQQEFDKLKISELRKEVEEFKVKEDMLKKTNKELYLLHDALTSKRQEEEGLPQALAKAEAKIGDLSAKVEELENAKQELEASLAKASHRFQTTVNSFNKFQSLSEKLIDEAQTLHLLLEDRDAEIALLKEEVAVKGSQASSLENTLTEKNMQTSQLLRYIRSMVERDASGGTELLELEGQADSTKELLEALAASIRAGSDSLRVQLARKDALLQDVQMRNEDLTRKVASLETSVLENQRLLEERGPLVAEQSTITVQSEEVANRGKHSMPPVAVVTHGRSGRKVSASDHLALDMELAESSRALIDLDNDEDKGHAFRSLTSLRLVPRGARFLVDRLDGFWVSGERLLRRRPGARLSVTLYWLILHIWMVALLL